MSAYDEVAAVIERWRSVLAARDADGLLALWDRSYPALSYLPTERPGFLTTWDEISAYVDRMCSGSPIQELRIADVTIDLLSEASAFAFGYVTQVSMAGGEERRWQGRMQFHFRHVEGEWRLIHYEDSTGLAEAGRFACRLQAPRRAEVADAIRLGDTALALRLLDELATPPPFSSADAMDATRARGDE